MEKVKPFKTSHTYKPKSKGLGIQNKIFDFISIKPPIFKIGGLMFKTIAKGGRLTHYPVIGNLFKRFMKLLPYDKRYTQSVVLPLEVPLSPEKAQGVILPMGIMKIIAREAIIRIRMDKCICRTGNGLPH